MLKDNKIVNNYGGIYFVYVRSFREDCWEEYEEPVLDEKEKEYLSAVIKPFRDRIDLIFKKVEPSKKDRLHAIWIRVFREDDKERWDYTQLPPFKGDTMYKGMKENMGYSLEDLGL